MEYRDIETCKKILEERNRDNAFANMIGLHTTLIAPGMGRAEMKITKDHMNPLGTVHGGVISTMADVTGGAGASCYGYNIVTLDCTIHYLRAGKNTTMLYGESKEVRGGNRILVYNVTIKDQDGEVLATAEYTYYMNRVPLLAEENTEFIK